MKPSSWLFSLLIVCLALPMLVQAQPTTPVPFSGTDIADRYTPGPINWQPCPENKTVECGTLTLPVDYHQPNGETFAMAVVRAKTTNPSQRIGVVFTNPGGPGISGIDQVVFGTNSPLVVVARQRFDLIGFDPRGVGRTRPVQCVPQSIKLPDTPGDEALASAFDTFSQAYAQDCLQQDGLFVTKLSTNNVARDMDVLRRALGEQKITYASGSYGTQLGAVYASLFPRHLRAMALDGGISPSFRDFYTEMTLGQSANFELELERVDVLCHRDAACRLRETGVVNAFDQLAARLDAKPYTAPNGVVLTGVSVTSAVYTLLYREHLAPLLVDMLANGLAGDYALMVAVLPAVDAGLEIGAIYAIRCNDYGTRRPAAEYLPIDEVNAARHPRFFGRYWLAYRLATCAAWPAADPSIIRNVQGKVETPILLIMNDFDPATPPAEMRELARALGMEQSVFRYRGGGHTFAKNDACTLKVFIDYLFELKLPAEGASCPGQPISFAPATQASSLQAQVEGRDQLWGFVEPLLLPVR